MLTFASHKKKVKKISIFMSKKFAEHNGLNLTQTNNDVLQMWKEKNVFWRSVTEREGCPSRAGAQHQGYLQPLQDHEGFPGKA